MKSMLVTVLPVKSASLRTQPVTSELLRVLLVCVTILAKRRETVMQGNAASLLPADPSRRAVARPLGLRLGLWLRFPGQGRGRDCGLQNEAPLSLMPLQLKGKGSPLSGMSAHLRTPS